MLSRPRRVAGGARAGLEEPVPASPYAAAKLAVGSFARMLHALHGLQVVNLRIFMVYGPGQHDRTKLVPYVVTSLLREEQPKLSSGTRPVDWVYVDDVVEAFIAASTRDDLAGTTLDIGTGELVTIRAIIERIVETVGTGVEPDFGALPERPLEIVRVADVERTKDIWLAATNDTHRGVTLDSRLVPRRDRARGTFSSQTHRPMKPSSRGQRGFARSSTPPSGHTGIRLTGVGES